MISTVFYTQAHKHTPIHGVNLCLWIIILQSSLWILNEGGHTLLGIWSLIWVYVWSKCSQALPPITWYVPYPVSSERLVSRCHYLPLCASSHVYLSAGTYTRIITGCHSTVSPWQHSLLPISAIYGGREGKKSTENVFERNSQWTMKLQVCVCEFSCLLLVYFMCGTVMSLLLFKSPT